MKNKKYFLKASEREITEDIAREFFRGTFVVIPNRTFRRTSEKVLGETLEDVLG